jgi:hypothetical protein
VKRIDEKFNEGTGRAEVTYRIFLPDTCAHSKDPGHTIFVEFIFFAVKQVHIRTTFYLATPATHSQEAL